MIDDFPFSPSTRLDSRYLIYGCLRVNRELQSEEAVQIDNVVRIHPLCFNFICGSQTQKSHGKNNKNCKHKINREQTRDKRRVAK